MKVAVTISLRDYDVVLFDLDGVLTKTASVHAAAWKRLFDGFLELRATKAGKPFVPFDIETDYPRYVDGKPRYDGVTDFLESRGIELPLGPPEDGADVQSVRALGNLKDRYFLEQLEQHGVEPYEPALALVRTLRAREIKTAVVSSSNNCALVLEAAGIARLFDARVDGLDLTRLELDGKPAPDAFLEAARRVGAVPSRAVVVEDAIAGVAAGRAGGFGCVIGVDRRGQAQALREAGADVVVTDLAQVQVAAEPSAAWALVYEDYDVAKEGIREALCTLGNGYFATRGAAAGAVADGIHYPGTYVAGGYNRLRTEIAGRVVENEDLVNFPNWLALKFRIGEGDWFDARSVKLLSYRQELDLRRGILLRCIRFKDGRGRQSTLEERRLVSMGSMHLGALELALTADNWSAGVTVRSGIDGRIVNAGAKLYRKFNNKHLEPLASKVLEEGSVQLLVRTCQSNLHVAQAARTRAFKDGQLLDVRRPTIEEPGYIAEELTVDLKQGETLVLEKLASLYTSRDPAISECGLEATKAIVRARSFDAELADHVHAWQHLWHQFEVHIEPADHGFTMSVPMLLRLHMFHLLQAVSPNSIGLDIGVPARGWTGEAYQGHVFWDELFIFPFFIGSAIAYNVWQYFQVPHDLEFLHFYGAELILDIVRFWSSMASFNDERGRYEIRGIMGPDEFHDAYPDSATPGINNIAYYAGRLSRGSTRCRVVCAWVMARSDRPRAMDFFAEALQSDVSDIQQGTTAEGVHLGAMAETVDLVQRVSTGLEVRGDVLHLAPELPREMERLDLRVRYRGHSLDLRLTRGSLSIRGRDGAAPPIPLCVDGEICEFVSGTTRIFRLNDAATDRGTHRDVPGDTP